MFLSRCQIYLFLQPKEIVMFYPLKCILINEAFNIFIFILYKKELQKNFNYTFNKQNIRFYISIATK